MNVPLQLESITREIEYRDPVLLFHHLCSGRSNCLLLESAEIDSKRHLNSFLLVEACLRLECRGQTVHVTSLTENGARLAKQLKSQLSGASSVDGEDGDFRATYEKPDSDLDEDQRLKAAGVFEPLRQLRQCVKINSTVPESLFVGGLFGYDLVECVEPLPELADAGRCPNYVFYVSESLIWLDHENNTGRLIGSFFYEPFESVDRDPFEQHQKEIQQQCQHFNLLDLPPSLPVNGDVAVDKDDEEFKAIVDSLKVEINRGTVFQTVPSRCYSLPCPSPLRAYRKLRQSNPSPYMFLLQDEAFTLFGASPEMAIKFTEATRDVEICPIAGTRPRGKHPDGTINADLDSRIELELRCDMKEMAEHLMLVDLARNDLARICKPGSRHIAQLLKVDRYSHVMHLVSRLVGKLRDDLDALHAYQACMNMGTLTGAPKVRAMQLIRQLEGQRRDSYGGGIGYFQGNGDMETCIVIRSALVIDGEARIQAGAGVVYDSDPQSEADETRNKAQAVISAVRSAHLD